MKNKSERTDNKRNKRSCENLPQRELHVHLPGIKEGAPHEYPSESRIHRKVLLLFPAQTEHADTLQPDGMQHHVAHFHRQIQYKLLVSYAAFY